MHQQIHNAASGFAGIDPWSAAMICGALILNTVALVAVMVVGAMYDRRVEKNYVSDLVSGRIGARRRTGTDG